MQGYPILLWLGSHSAPSLLVLSPTAADWLQAAVQQLGLTETDAITPGLIVQYNVWESAGSSTKSNSLLWPSCTSNNEDDTLILSPPALVLAFKTVINPLLSISMHQDQESRQFKFHGIRFGTWAYPEPGCTTAQWKPVHQQDFRKCRDKAEKRDCCH